ncbi:MAG TPA: NADH-ubiquinone oxidoreductase-F iron-sulfur binding region domain-containing protein [Ktedonobacterales bacterium]|nr:NADH-ubiquinone oxidoreductase-F iron-sulfur binding region domain-containing protein [Ktedonobacterales bacterium]
MPDTPFRLLVRSDAPALVTYDAYRQEGGYSALRQALTTMTPEQVIAEVRSAGLRGRGGAGVLTAEKLTLAARSDTAPKYIIANAYDADPRSRISRTLLARAPHRIVEGMALAAYAVGASEGFLYMRGGDPDLAATVNRALREAQENGILGSGVFGTRFNLTINLVGVEIGFMGGEESTLIQVLKGRPAKAQQRPPYPTEYGLFNRPTIVQNAETLANLPDIVVRGGEAFRAVGTKATPGTKLFTVIGADTPEDAGVLVEVPFGATIQDALRLAGISVNETNARAVVLGGKEGGVLPLSRLSTPLDYESLEDTGAIIGSSIIQALPVNTCMVAWAMRQSDYLAAESCGKCVPCRVGVKRIAGTLEGIASGLGATGDLALLEEFSRYVPDGSLCGFGVNAVHPVVTAMQYFADDFTAHLEGRCPMGTCLPVRTHRYATKHVL